MTKRPPRVSAAATSVTIRRVVKLYGGAPIRLVSYNILNGGTGRADPLAEVLLAQRADVIVLQEASDPAVLDRLARRLKMDFAIGDGPKHPVAIFSRWEIEHTINHGLLTAGAPSMLMAVIRSGDGVRWPVCGLHLHPRAALADEAVRLKQLDVVLGVLQPLRAAGAPHIVAGDFNSTSPIARVEPEKLRPNTREYYHGNGDRLPVEVIDRVLKSGYVDSLAAVAGEQTAGCTYTLSTLYPGQRVDYIFTHGVDESRLRTAWVEEDRLAKYASDHFPVGVEIDPGVG